MKFINIFFLSIVLLFAIVTFSCRHKQDIASAGRLTDYVDPFIGTDFFGHTFPGATLPFGMVQLSPDTGTDGWTYSSGYSYQDSTIMGFSHTHVSGTGNTICGDILMMPTVGNRILVTPGTEADPKSGYRSAFDHEYERAAPGYYEVYLKDYKIRAELTATRRAGMQKYTFPKAAKAPVIIDLGHTIGGLLEDDMSKITIVNDSVVRGIKESKGIKVYFESHFSKPFKYYGTFDASYFTPESGASLYPYKNEEIGQDIGAFLIYETEEGEELIIKTGLSYVSLEGAAKNLTEEINHWDFDRTVKEAQAGWNKELSRIEVSTGDVDKKEIFYTAVYHSFLAQQIAQDADGQYIGMDGQVHSFEGSDFYPSFSCWDTYRTEHPLMTLIAPEHVNDMIKSIVAKTKEFGWLPAQHFRNEFGQGMVGDHLIPLIVDAYMKGYRDYDTEFIYEAMKTKALELPKDPIPAEAARSGLKDYINLGYAAADRVTESVPNTLELAYNDWCIAQMAKEMGKEEDYKLFAVRAQNYKNLFDAETEFFRPKLADGSWLPEINNFEQQKVRNGEHGYYKYFDPLLVGRRPFRHYTESNAWQYLWSVQHDPAALVSLLGGNELFSNRLDEFFLMSPTITPPKYVGVVGTIGQYVHGNQPSHHVAYLYNFAQKPWMTQYWVRNITDRLYRTGPGGLPGNEDMGSLSSWYVLSALGFYPVTPGTTQYALGSPMFDKVSIKLEDEKVFDIIAKNNRPENFYIQEAKLNGKELDRSWIDHGEIMEGGSLELVMGPEPNKNWAADTEAIPFSMNKDW